MRTVRAAGPSAISRPTGLRGQVRSANHLSVPKGWRSYTYSGAAISVPESWTVEHNTNCPLTTASGALLLGFPKVLMSCPSYPISLGLVELYHPTQVDTPKSRHIELHGVAVAGDSSVAFLHSVVCPVSWHRHHRRGISGSSDPAHTAAGLTQGHD